MFSIEEIENAHSKVKSGADFPSYIREIKLLGVTAFETWVFDSHTEYFGSDDYTIKSDTQYSALDINYKTDIDAFKHKLKIHQQGETDYYTFCTHCAETGIEKWNRTFT